MASRCSGNLSDIAGVYVDSYFSHVERTTSHLYTSLLPSGAEEFLTWFPTSVVGFTKSKRLCTVRAPQLSFSLRAYTSGGKCGMHVAAYYLLLKLVPPHWPMARILIFFFAS